MLQGPQLRLHFYDRSPIIAYDEEKAPSYTMGTFTSATVSRLPRPHVWIEEQHSLYTTRWVRIIPCCASIPRRASMASSRRPRSAAFRSPFLM